MNRAGFTMLELLMAVMILSVMTVITFFTFNSLTRTWTKSVEVAETFRGVNSALEQVASGLRSAYYPTTGQQDYKYGLMLLDDGDDTTSHDTIQWIKLGTAIIGNRTTCSEKEHTVRLTVREEGRDGPGGLVYKYGDFDLLPEDPDEEVSDFENDEFFPWHILAEDVQGFNCRVADKDKPYNEDGSWNWQDEWEYSNSLPRAVELTLWLKPVKARAEPEAVVRVIEIPLWDISQNPVSTSSSDGKDANTQKDRDRRGGGRQNQQGGQKPGAGQGPRGGAPATPPGGGAPPR